MIQPLQLTLSEKALYLTYQLWVFAFEFLSQLLEIGLNFLCRLGALDQPSLESKKWFNWLKDRNTKLPSTYEFTNSKGVWVHFASGEFQYAKPVIEGLIKLEHPLPVIATYFSPSAKPMLEKFYSSLSEQERVHFIFFPMLWDKPSCIKNLIHRFQPKCLLLARSELWPAQIIECNKMGLPILFFCVKQTQTKSGLIQRLQNILLRRLTEIHLVSQADLDNLSQQLGKREGPKLQVCGDTRAEALIKITQTFFDQETSRPYSFLSREQRKLSFFRLILASTWPKDESQIFKALLTLTNSPQLNFSQSVQVFWAPHEVRPKQFEKAQAWAKALGLGALRWSEIINGDHRIDAPSLIWIDSVGHLFDLYPEMHLAFVGGSFRRRVHNVLEPLAWGTPVVVGPRILNSREAIELNKIESKKPLIRVENSQELSKVLAQHMEAFIKETPSNRLLIRSSLLNLSGGVSSAINWVKSKLNQELEQRC